MPATVARLIVAIAFAASFGAAFAQPTVPRIDEMVEVSLVNVDVVVTDREGKRVRGLSRDDFEVLENGVPQPITNFAEYASGATLTAQDRVTVDAASAPASAPPRRTIVIFVESFVMPPFHAKPLFEQLRETVRRVVRPGDSVAVVSWANTLIVRQDFTDDVAALEKALHAVEKESSGSPFGGSIRNEEAIEAMFEGSLARESFRAMDDHARRSGDALDRALLQLFKIRQKTFALSSLMQRISAFEGRKVVLMAMQRYGEHAGAEYFGGFVPGQYRAMLDTRQYRDALTDNANANGITLYPLFPGGMGSTTFMSANLNRGTGRMSSDGDMRRAAFNHEVLTNELRSLDELARETGGMMQWSSKEIVSLLPRIAEDLESYYSLAYRATSRKAGSQKIAVRTKNRAYEVRARREFTQKSDQAKMNDLVVANLFDAVPGGVIPLEPEVVNLQQQGRKRWTATLRVRIPIDALTVVETDKGPAGEFSIYVAPGALFGLATEVQRRLQPFTIGEDQLGRAWDSYFTYEFELQLDHMTDRVSIGVFDEISKEFGLARVQVPERKMQ